MLFCSEYTDEKNVFIFLFLSYFFNSNTAGSTEALKSFVSPKSNNLTTLYFCLDFFD